MSILSKLFLLYSSREIIIILPRAEQDNVGVVPRNPESVTSSTVSPIDSTKVALTNETTMYESKSSTIKIEN